MIKQRHSSVPRPFKMFVVIVLIVFVAMLSTPRSSFADSPRVVGAAPSAHNSIEVVGKIDQVALAFSGYGYLTAIDGIPNNQLFTDLVNHSEASAHFTYVSTATLTSRSVLDTLFILDSVGTTTIYYNEVPQAKFDDPKSFSLGVPIAVGDEHWQTIVNVQAPNIGIVTGVGEYTQTSQNPFNLNGQQYILGNPNQFMRYIFTGEGKRTDKDAPNSTLIIAGYATAGDK